MLARRDIVVLFLTRTVRLWAYGTVGVILALYLNAVGLSNDQLGVLLTLTLLGDSLISLAVTRWADRVGRRFMLLASCLLMILAGAVYGEVRQPSFVLLLAAATIGVLSPSGNEVGPFMALEQSILAELVSPANRTHVFAWYNLVGYSMTALGALAAGSALTWAQRLYDMTELTGYRAVFLQYGLSGVVLLVLFAALTDRVERPELRMTQTGSVTATAAATTKTTAADPGSNRTAWKVDEEEGLRQPLLAEVEDEAEEEAEARDRQGPVQKRGGPQSAPCTVEAAPSEVSRCGLEASAQAGGREGGGAPFRREGGAFSSVVPVVVAAAAGAAATGAAAGAGSFPVVLTEGALESHASGVDGSTQPRRRPTSSASASLPLLAADSDEGPHDRDGGGGGSSADAREGAQRKDGCAGGTTGSGGGSGGAVGAMGLSARSRRLVVHLSLLFATDSFAGGLVTGTMLAYFFQTKYGVSTAYLGSLLFGANLLAALSSLASGWVAAHIGLINTMVFTHLPSNLLMLLVPLMPSLRAATLVVFLRFSISQMDVAPRASFVAGVVRPDERTAAMGIVNIAKSTGAAFGPVLTGWLAERGLFSWAFYLCGGLKILYDLTLLWSFSHVKAEH